MLLLANHAHSTGTRIFYVVGGPLMGLNAYTTLCQAAAGPADYYGI